MTRSQPPSVTGLHHVTAVARDPARNVDFYTRVLGLHLIKRTVNFDNPGVYHLYYGDTIGRPGTILTFFVRLDGADGRVGNRQVSGVRFSVPPDGIDAWVRHLGQCGIDFSDEMSWCDARTLSFRDPEGLTLQLVAGTEHTAETSRWPDPGALRVDGLHGVELSVPEPEPTVRVLLALGFREVRSQAAARRFAAPGNGPGLFVDVHGNASLPDGEIGVGCVHHVAFRTRDDERQRAWQQRLREAGLEVTEVRDRKYFRSIYFHEPAGIRFEIATDAPGFAVDEAQHALGHRLQLPPVLEPDRETFEARLGVLTPSSFGTDPNGMRARL